MKMERVKEVFHKQLERYGGGGRLAVYQHGQLLLDVWGGVKTKEADWDANTLAHCASCTKGITNICVARLVDQGVLRYDQKIRESWKEFGDTALTLSELLSHRGGLLHFSEMVEVPVAALEACSGPPWEDWVAFLARQPPVAEVRGHVAYHAITVGFFVSALIYKATGESLRAYYDREIRKPFDVQFFMGAVQGKEANLARVLPSKVKEQRRMVTPLAVRAYQPMNDMSSFFRLRNCEAPSHIGWGSGQSLAWLWQLVVTDRLFSPAVRAQSFEIVCKTDCDLVLQEPVEFTRGGFMVMDAFTGSRETFGHPGLGGQLAFCDPRYGLSVGLTVNAFLDDSRPRLRELAGAIYTALDSMTAKL
jgi:CubicO group peptidase (beta-lactamase class C family)